MSKYPKCPSTWVLECLSALCRRVPECPPRALHVPKCSKSTQRTLQEQSKGTPRALGLSGHLGTGTLEALGHSKGTRALPCGHTTSFQRQRRRLTSATSTTSYDNVEMTSWVHRVKALGYLGTLTLRHSRTRRALRHSARRVLGHSRHSKHFIQQTPLAFQQIFQFSWKFKTQTFIFFEIQKEAVNSSILSQQYQRMLKPHTGNKPSCWFWPSYGEDQFCYWNCFVTKMVFHLLLIYTFSPIDFCESSKKNLKEIIGFCNINVRFGWNLGQLLQAIFL